MSTARRSNTAFSHDRDDIKRARQDSSASLPSSSEPVSAPHVIAQFRAEDGSITGPPLDLPLDVTPDHLKILLDSLLKNKEEETPYSFFVNDEEIVKTVSEAFYNQGLSTEATLNIVYLPQAVFRVKAVTRCTSSLPGHSEAVLIVSFSPNGKKLASGSGDKTVRFWDIHTQTPELTCTGHTSPVLALAWAPDGSKVVSADQHGLIFVWDAETGKAVCGPLRGHTSWVNSLCWEPIHINPKCIKFASASKDGTVRIWDTVHRKCVMTLAQHTASVTSVKWGGEGLIYTGSHDRTVKVWRAEDGVMCRTLVGHAHRVNTMTLSTDYALRTGAYDHTGTDPATPEQAQEKALQRYETAKGGSKERLVSGSDDFTMFLWDPTDSKQHVARMTGHQQPINQISFSPDGRFIASASFDKSVKLWDGKTGKFLATFRGHVGPVYQVSWSSDSRLLVSGSRDSTMKVWDAKTHALKFDLPGHADEVFAVDWSPDGQSVASGSKDTLLKIWRS